jgi:putative addiction module component (TIGR02574 family)
MTTKVKRIFDDAMKLTEKQRAELTGKLLDTLEPHPDQDVHAAWAAEIEKRVDELERGIVKAVPWSEARKRIARRIRKAARGS